MVSEQHNVVINLTAVIVAVTDDRPRVLVVEQSGELGLPSGPFDPVRHDSLENGLRRWVEAQTGLDLYYVEQLYTFGNRNRDPREIEGGPRVVSVAYIALTHEDAVGTANAKWHDWYSILPWEDWRSGRPEVLSEHIEPALKSWAQRPKDRRSKQLRQDRVNVMCGPRGAADIDLVQPSSATNCSTRQGSLPKRSATRCPQINRSQNCLTLRTRPRLMILAKHFHPITGASSRQHSAACAANSLIGLLYSNY